MRFRSALAWCVHLYTATGLVLAALVAVLIVRGGPQDLHSAFLLLLVATLVDATDGYLARRVHVQSVLPSFSGRTLDDIVDFHTYTSLPLLLIWRSALLPPDQAGWLLLPLLASAYGFAQVSAKTDDGYFVGFPSYWNVVAFYLYFLRPPTALSLAVLIGFALLTFVPTRYLYPSRTRPLRRTTLLLGAAWGLMCLAVLLGLAPDPGAWLLASLFYPGYYLVASWTLSLRRRAVRAPA